MSAGLTYRPLDRLTSYIKALDDGIERCRKMYPNGPPPDRVSTIELRRNMTWPIDVECIVAYRIEMMTDAITIQYVKRAAAPTPSQPQADTIVEDW